MSAEPRVLPEEERHLSFLGREKILPRKTAENPEDIIFFDLETQKSAEQVGGWDNKRAMRVSVAVTYNLRKGRFDVFTEDKIGDLLQELLVADLIIGFNIKR
ncbi:unnamed protein product, partial [marine sediment metagenome]